MPNGAPGRLAVVALPVVLVACGSSRGAGAPSPADASTDGPPVDSSLPDAQPGDGPSGAPQDGGTDAPGDASADAPGEAAVVPLPALPLHTTSRWIVDANGKRFKLASVSWYGAEEKDFVVAGLDFQDVHAIAKTIRALGFNSVRLPFSNQLVETNPLVASARLAANPSLQGRTALEVMDAVIEALAEQGLVVILDDHTSNADWCCSTTDGNGLWYTPGYPESAWLADWKTMATRYLAQPAVVAADLRNELRASDAGTPTWDGTGSALDWHGAAERGGNAVLGVNPALLVIVEGLSYSNDLTGVYSLPVQLPVDGRLVYSPHDYEFDHPAGISAANLATDLGNEWGYILAQGKTYTAPVWVGEFGTCNTAASCVSGTSDQGGWFAGFGAYLQNADIDWSYWAINGTEASGTGRTLGAPETYGVLDTAWDAGASDALTEALQALEPATQGP